MLYLSDGPMTRSAFKVTPCIVLPSWTRLWKTFDLYAHQSFKYMGTELHSYPCLKYNRSLLLCRTPPGLSFLCPKWRTKQVSQATWRWQEAAWQAFWWRPFSVSRWESAQAWTWWGSRWCCVADKGAGFRNLWCFFPADYWEWDISSRATDLWNMTSYLGGSE